MQFLKILRAICCCASSVVPVRGISLIKHENICGVEIEFQAYLTLQISVDVGERSASRHGKSPEFPLDMRMGGPQSRSERCGDMSITLTGIEPQFLSQPVPNLVSIKTELTQFQNILVAGF
jgi:hypothetical protein